MRSEPTPPAMLAELNAHPMAQRCWRNHLLHDHECQGRLTWEHAVTHAGRRVNEVWAIVRICAYAHEVDQFQDGGGMVKEINRWIAFSRIENWGAVLAKYPRTSWPHDYWYLKRKYGDTRIE